MGNVAPPPTAKDEKLNEKLSASARGKVPEQTAFRGSDLSRVPRAVNGV